VEGDPELRCPQVIDVENPPPGTSTSVDRNFLHPFQVSLKGKGKECRGGGVFPSLFL
jgi:hypothetical protein